MTGYLTAVCCCYPAGRPSAWNFILTMIRKLVPLAALVLGACSSTTGIVPIGSGMYMLGAQDGWAYTGSSVKADLYHQANDFCARDGKQVEPVNSRGQDYGLGQYASAEIQFRCVERTAHNQ